MYPWLRELQQNLRIPGSIRAPSPQFRPRKLQPNGSQPPNHSRDARQQCARPAVAKVAIQQRSEQGEDAARDGAEDGEGPDGGGGVHGVAVQEVGLDALEADDEAEAVDGHAGVGHDPVQVRVGGPAVAEETGGDEDGGGDHHVDPEFGDADVVVARLAEQVDLGGARELSDAVVLIGRW